MAWYDRAKFRAWEVERWLWTEHRDVIVRALYYGDTDGGPVMKVRCPQQHVIVRCQLWQREDLPPPVAGVTGAPSGGVLLLGLPKDVEDAWLWPAPGEPRPPVVVRERPFSLLPRFASGVCYGAADCRIPAGPRHRTCAVHAPDDENRFSDLRSQLDCPRCTYIDTHHTSDLVARYVLALVQGVSHLTVSSSGRTL